MFDHTCNFRIPTEGQDVEELELEMIDFGVEEIFADEDKHFNVRSFENFDFNPKELDCSWIRKSTSGFERIPQIKKNNTEQVQMLKTIRKN